MITPIKFSIHKEGVSSTCDESNIHVELSDEGAGYFATISDTDGNEVKVDFTEIEELHSVLVQLKTIAQTVIA